MAKFCMNCGNPINENAAFCIRCGKPVTYVQPQPVCPYCGRILDPKDRFCTGCGRALPSAAQPRIQQPQQMQPQARPVQPQPQQMQPQVRPVQPQPQQVQPQPQQVRPVQPQPQQMQQARPVQPVQQPQPLKAEKENIKDAGASSIQPKKKKKKAAVWLIIAAAAAASVFSILAFVKPGFGRNWFRKTVKLENGTLELDEFSFDFSESDMEDGTVSLCKDRISDALSDEGLVSDIYEMTIDGECSDPVTVTMKVPKEYTGKGGQALMLAIGTDYDMSTDAEVGRHYCYVEAEVDGDTATAVFIPEDILQPQLLYRKGKDFGVLSDDSEPSGKKYTGSRVVRFGETLRNWVNGENPRFLISYPYFYDVPESETNAFIKDLEDMWDWYAAKGYSFEGLLPLDIYIIKGSEGDPDAAFSRSKLGQPLIEFRRKFIFGEGKTPDYSANTDISRPLMYHEFFHAIQDQYIGQNRHTLWFDEATATYYEHCAETRFGISSLYKYAKTSEENYLLALESMIPRSKKIADLETAAENASYWDQVWNNKKNIIYSKIGEEGYARGPFCDIVSEMKGDDSWIRNIYEGWKTGGVSDFKCIEEVANSIPGLAFKLYQRFIFGTYTDTGYIALSGKAYYYYNKNSLNVTKKDLEDLEDGTKKSLTITGRTFQIYGQGAVVVGLNISDINLFKGDTKYNITVSVKGEDLEYETYELWKYDGNPVSGNYIKNVYKAMGVEKNRYSTLVVSKKPFEAVDEFTIIYEITAYKDEPEPSEEPEGDDLTAFDVEGSYKLGGSGTKAEYTDLDGVMVKDEKVVSDLSATMTVKALSEDRISVEITGDINFKGECKFEKGGKVDTGKAEISIGFHKIDGVSTTVFWETDDLYAGFAGTK